MTQSMWMLKDCLDWDRIMKTQRYAGGHTGVMDVLFKNSHVLTSHVEDDYSGTVGYVYLIYDFHSIAKIVVISDSFGSCSGCDSWEDSSDEDARNLCIQLANNAHLFDSIQEAVTFLKNIVANKDNDNAHHYDLIGIAAVLANNLELIKHL
jgi:hypothetical protein